MKHKNPPWDRDVRKISFPALAQDIETDVAIIGGGICGIVLSYLLGREGISTVLLEKETLGSGATGLTTAFLTQSIDTEPADLVKMLGETDAGFVFASHGDAIDLYEEIIREEDIDCDFMRCSDRIFALEEKEMETLLKQNDNLRMLGVDSYFYPASIIGIENNGGFIEIPDQAKFHPLKFLYGTAQASKRLGVKIFEHTEVKDIEEKEKIKILKTPHANIRAKWVVSATYEPFDEPVSLVLKKGMYVSYVMELTIPKDILLEGIYEDTENPYHYFRVDSREDNDRMILGGEDVKAIFPVSKKERFEALQQYIRTNFDNFPFTVDYMWTGPILEPSDGLPSIGAKSEKLTDRMLYAFGFSGNGMTYSGIAAMILRDKILGYNNPYYHLYRTSRFMSPKSLAMKARDYVGEFTHGVLLKSTHSKGKRKKSQS